MVKEAFSIKRSSAGIYDSHSQKQPAELCWSYLKLLTCIIYNPLGYGFKWKAEACFLKQILNRRYFSALIELSHVSLQYIQIDIL